MMAHLNMLLNVVAHLELFDAHGDSFEHVVKRCGSQKGSFYPMMAHLLMLLNFVAYLEFLVAHDDLFEHVERCGSLRALCDPRWLTLMCCFTLWLFWSYYLPMTPQLNMLMNFVAHSELFVSHDGSI
jgi:hypothetical protein